MAMGRFPSRFKEGAGLGSVPVDLLFADLPAEELEALLFGEEGQVERLVSAQEARRVEASSDEYGCASARKEAHGGVVLDVVEYKQATFARAVACQFVDYRVYIAFEFET